VIAHITSVTEHGSPGMTQRSREPSSLGANVAGGSRVRRPEWVRDRDVWLVDDVMTTRATFEACVEQLAEAGARPVGLALAWAQ
jgi:predicted amidophosphoribosyltransferase